MLPPPDRPWVIAHRGASHALPENTVAAFREACARGADAVEMDVRSAADRSLVVHHDAAIPGVGPIVELDRATIEREAPWVPLLEAAISACAGMWIDVEVKNSPAEPDWDPNHDTARRTAATLEGMGVLDRVLLSSFDPGSLRAAAAVSPEIRTGWLSGVRTDPGAAIRTAAGLGCFSVHPGVTSLAGDAAAVAVMAARSRGLRVIVWTVDDEAEILRLAGAGADGLITNRPGAARSALEHDDRHRG